MSSGQSRREGADAKLRRTRATRPSADKTAIRPRRLHLCGDQTVMENVLEQDTRYRRCRSDRREGRVFPGQQAHGAGQCRALRNEERPAQRRHDPHHGSGGAIYLSRERDHHHRQRRRRAFVRAAAAEPSKSSALDLTPSDEGPARTCKRGSVPRRLGRDRKGEPCEQDPRHRSRRPDWRAGG
jgi:hypothetical protein